MSNEQLILFISSDEAREMHDMVINENGGRQGIHDERLLESAMDQPLMVLSYGDNAEQEIPYLAATYFFHKKL